jgi:hypothetical protein
MESVGLLRQSFSDAFITLPLITIGLVFFLGMLTSNIGLIYLFFGHLLVVPSLAFFGNEKGFPLWSEGEWSPAKAIKYIISLVVLFTVYGASLEGETKSSLSYLIYLAVLIPLIGQGIQTNLPAEQQKSFFFFYNPFEWFMQKGDSSASSKAATTACEMFPTGSEDAIYTTPSNWVNHLSFFFGFVIANAVGIYNEPTPKASGATEEAVKASAANIERRVTNRKWLAGTITALSIVVFLIILMFRYNKTECEQSFWISLIPILIATLTGVSWFKVVHTKCGVRPADVLGIVQGMIPSELIDNPIVCVGST